MGKRTRIFLVGAVLSAGVVFLALVYMESSEHPPVITKESFVFDPENGLAASIPETYVNFMGLPVVIVLDRGGFIPPAPTNEDIERANDVLKLLPGCIAEVEARLLEYAGSEMVEGGDDVANPQIFLADETDRGAWTFVIEMKDNDGYGWHLEFHEDQFHEIWSGS